MHRIAGLLVSLALVFTVLPSAALAVPPAPNPDANSWIVTLRDGDPQNAARSLTRAHGGQVTHVYNQAINGFAFRGSSAAAEAMRRNPNVALVEADAEVWLDTTQLGATWGLDRIDQRDLPLDTEYTYNATGAGVTAYVIDSGINFSHGDLGGRAIPGVDLVGDGQNGDDCNGHGTHVSGTIGGSTWGVAKATTLVSVRVFGCTGGSSWSTIIAAIEWVIADHNGPADAGPDVLAVANMSLGGGASSSVDQAVRNMVADGVSTAVAAGNGNRAGRQDDACNYSPARVAEAMTISATDKTDTKASWANYGNCVDWFAPGVSITSAWYTSDIATNTISGTSMATPHTAGAAALYLQANPTHTPQQVRDALFANSTQGIVRSSSTANNHLLYTGFIGGGGDGGGDTPTTGTLTGSVTDATTGAAIGGAAVSIDGTSLSDTTATDGSYSISDVPAGTATATASASGYDAASADVEIVAGESTNQDFPLAATSGGGGDDDPATFGVTLTPSSTSQGSNWTAIVTITATDSTGAPVDAVTVTGAWSNGATGTATCTTESTGECSVSVSGIRKRTGSVTFTVTDVSPTDGWNGSEPSTVVLKP